MYGFWIKPDRFKNFQEFYAVYLNQLKSLAYKFEDLFFGKVERFHEAGIDGYIVEGGKRSDVTEYLKAFTMPKVQYSYTIATTGTIAAKLVAGSVLISTEGINDLIIDDGFGRLKLMNDKVVGSIDYETGKYSLTVDVSDFGKVVVGYATSDANVTYSDFENTVDGTTETIKEIKGGLIPNTQAGFTAHIIAIDGENKFFVGLTTNNLESQSNIISKLLGYPITVSNNE